MFRIVIKEIIWREIDSSAEPCIPVCQFEISQIHVNGRYHRAERVENEGDAGCKNRLRLYVHPFCDSARKNAVDCGIIDSGFLKYAAVLKHTASSAATVLVRP